jgi:hypothetical protein
LSSVDCGMYYTRVRDKARVKCKWGSKFNNLEMHFAWKSWGILVPNLTFFLLSQYVFNKELLKSLSSQFEKKESLLYLLIARYV